ncbi:MAG: class I SAM-dependent methyltransferase [Bacteriovoracaceae bacterium]
MNAELESKKIFTRTVLSSCNTGASKESPPVEANDGQSLYKDEAQEVQKLAKKLRSLMSDTSNNPLRKALGKAPYRQVYDLTLGGGIDSLFLWSYLENLSRQQKNVHKLISYERNENVFKRFLKVIQELILNQEYQKEYLNSWDLIHGNAMEDDQFRPDQNDILYYDPMFQDIRSKSTPSKTIQWIKDEVGEDRDQVEFAEFLLGSNAGKLIIKRHPKAPELLKIKPTSIIEAKLVRFDVYQL